jgi:tRNA 2-selenouridine synthase
VPNLPQSDAFKSIILNHTPLIDVRAPVEFGKGAFPGAVNLPLMSNEERHLVGIRYKERGNEEATELGHSLVSGDTKGARVKAWSDFIDLHPDAMLYCFRGGQRSQISQQWLKEIGIDIVRLKGGYKAFRRYLIEETEHSCERFNPLVLGGRTGSGKTILLQKLHNTIDLEALANHRGSSFGRHITPQPGQIDFENALAYALIEKLERGFKRLVFEDEGKNIGKDYLPDSLHAHLSQSPLIILETTIEKRIAITLDEYVVQAQDRYRQTGDDKPFEAWKEDMLQAMVRIRKRLGGLRHQRLIELFETACRQQLSQGSVRSHEEWIAYLLTEYYDPMYDYQIERRSKQIVFRGNAGETEAYLKSLS